MKAPATSASANKLLHGTLHVFILIGFSCASQCLIGGMRSWLDTNCKIAISLKCSAQEKINKSLWIYWLNLYFKIYHILSWWDLWLSITISYNFKIYNFSKLKNILKSAKFSSAEPYSDESINKWILQRFDYNCNLKVEKAWRWAFSL